MITNEYVLNCPEHDIPRMIALYEAKLVEAQEHIDHLKMLAALGQTESAITPHHRIRSITHRSTARFDVV